MKIDIVLITYNHAKYINQCIDSILMQQTEISVEVIVADDCSTDNTLQIVKEYAKLSRFKFIFLPDESNLGFIRNYKRAFDACTADYIAVIEGDDYWTDPKRLQKHADFLENHRECVMTMNRFIEYYESLYKYKVAEWSSQKSYEYISTQQMALENQLGNLSACVFRRSEVTKIKPNLYDIEIGDWILGLVLSQYGFIAILNEVMSVYRKHQHGLWTNLNKEKQLEIKNMLIDKYNKYLEYKYNDEFTLHKIRLNALAKPTARHYTIRHYIPPVIIYAFKLLTPKFFRDFLRKISGKTIK